MAHTRHAFLSAVAGGLLFGDRAFAKTRRRDGGPVVDAHAHWFPEEWMKMVETEGAPYNIKMDAFVADHELGLLGCIDLDWDL